MKTPMCALFLGVTVILIGCGGKVRSDVCGSRMRTEIREKSAAEWDGMSPENLLDLRSKIKVCLKVADSSLRDELLIIDQMIEYSLSKDGKEGEVR